MDIGAVLKGDLHDSFAWNFNDLDSGPFILQFFEAYNLGNFPSTLDRDYQWRQFVYLQLQCSIDICGYLEFRDACSDKYVNCFTVLEWNLEFIDLLPIFYCLNSENLIEVEILTVCKWQNSSLQFKHVELSPLIFSKIVQKLSSKCQLFERRSKYGIFTKVDFGLIHLQTFRCLQQHERVFVDGLLLALIFHLIIINTDCLSMSAQINANRIKLQEMKKRRLDRLGQTSQASEPARSEVRLQRKEHSLQKSENIHVSGMVVETYDMEVQCALETRSLDSRPTKEKEEAEKEIDLLQPREHKQRKREDGKKQEQPKEIPQLNAEELNSVVKSRVFTDFFNRSSKFLEKVLDHGDGDMIELLLKQGLKSKEKSGHDILAHGITFTDPNHTNNRVVTDIDWSPQISDLFLASYSQNQQGSIKDHVGVVLLWNPALKNRAQFYCFCQSAVTSAKYYPFSNSTVLGGCYNGQLLLWDIRVKSMPVQRSGISADAHKYPVCSLNVVGTQIANNIVSFSNDGMMCMWDIKQFSKPTRMNRLTANRSQRSQSKPTAGTPHSINRPQRPDSSIASIPSASTSILDRTAKQEVHDITITCCQFPQADANNYYIGSLNGVLYKNALHNKGSQKIGMFDQHNGPISGVSVNRPSQFDALNGLVLTSSFDWTVKLWTPEGKDSLRTFECAEDYIYDVSWHPTNPSLFATVNNDGYLDVFDLTRDLELPIAHEKVNRSAQNKCHWNNEGSAIATGDSSGSVNLFLLAEKYRKMDNSKYDDLARYLSQKQDTD